MYRRVTVERLFGADERRAVDDDIVVEEPLEIRLNDRPLAITMRTPGSDEALAIGFLVTEQILTSREELFDVTRCADPDHPDLRNIVNAYVNPEGIPEDLFSGRQRYATSSCGLCGRAAIEQVTKSAPPISAPPEISRQVLYSLPDKLREAQEVFRRTGGLHAAGIFSVGGELLCLQEDVGRHNAVDKAVGRAFLDGRWPLDDVILMVSGRAGFEIVQKALAARIPAVCSVSAPSSLAVTLAREANMVLAGFVRGQSLNVYAGGNYLEP